MIEPDKKIVDDFFYSHRITEKEFLNTYSGDIKSGSKHFETLLNDTLISKDPSDLECAMTIGSYFRLWNDKLIYVFNKLLLEDWHFQHENIVNSLQSAKNPTSIDALYLTALKEFDYLNYDDTFALARKCTWALSDINTPESIEKLRLLSQSSNEYIKKYAEKRLLDRT